MEFFAEYGLIGMFIAGFLAATILPFSSEALFIALLTQNINVVSLVLVASIGNILGGMSSYYLGYIGNWRILEKFFGVNRLKAELYKDKINRYGSLFALLCWAPVIGDVIAVALGLYRNNPMGVLLYMTIGKTLRYIALLKGYELL